MSTVITEVTFLDADKPAHPLVLTDGWDYEIVRSVASSSDERIVRASGEYLVRITHYVRKTGRTRR